MADAGGGPVQQFEVRVPTEREGGVYANMLGVWHTGHEFTLDFSATMPAERIETPDGVIIRIPCALTARLKVPPTMVFDIIRALNSNMTEFEAKFGAIRRPGGDLPLYPPDEDPGGSP